MENIVNKDNVSPLQLLNEKLYGNYAQQKTLFPCYKTAFEKLEKKEDKIGSTDGNPLTFELYFTDTDTAVYI